MVDEPHVKDGALKLALLEDALVYVYVRRSVKVSGVTNVIF